MMESTRTLIGQPWFDIILSGAILCVAVLAGLFIKIIVAGYISRLAAKTSWKWDDPVIRHLRKAIILWCVLLGLYFAKEIWKASIPENTSLFADKTLITIFGLSAIITIANIATALIGIYGEKIHQAMPLTSLTQNLVRIVIIILGVLMVLNALGISITPLLTAMGIGGLAVALALQDTLSNVFSGFYITVARNIRPGDFIKLESGEEGYVVDISWRVTKVRLLANNIVLIPNSKLSQSVVTNYYLPEKEVAVLVQVGVHYNSNLEFVEKVTGEVAKEIQQTVPGAVKTFEPFIRYHTFGDSSINFSVIMRAGEFVANYLMKHEFIKRLHERYKKEGIIIPYPIRAINLEQEKVDISGSGIKA
ncbi:MAG: mechanosensitive ion channel family protein [Planctomycetes bacterium]|nr:mechanosensitive ion channel family protein [Planctomycetota bacterium]